MLGRIGRAWRRMVVGIGLTFVFVVLSFATGAAERSLDGEPTPAVFLALGALIAAAIVVTALVALLAAVAPGSLPVVELVAMSLILTLPYAVFRAELGIPAWTEMVALFAIILVLDRVSTGQLLAGLGRRDTRPQRTTFLAPYPVQEVWSLIVPLPENAGTYFAPGAAFMDPPEGSDASYVLYQPKRSHLAQSPEAYWVETIDPPGAVTFRTAPLAGGPGVPDRQSFRLTAIGTRTQVEVEVSYLDVPLLRRIRLWLNNDPGDYFASLRNHAFGRRDSSIHGRQVLPA
ncbi:MAG: hypothetical protein QNJ13_18320 [Paracoccaceae bacterium]|nr:hypothetical protein [Paracoccaceae bacterium]